VIFLQNLLAAVVQGGSENVGRAQRVQCTGCTRNIVEHEGDVKVCETSSVRETPTAAGLLFCSFSLCLMLLTVTKEGGCVIIYVSVYLFVCLGRDVHETF